MLPGMRPRTASSEKKARLAREFGISLRGSISVPTSRCKIAPKEKCNLLPVKMTSAFSACRITSRKRGHGP